MAIAECPVIYIGRGMESFISSMWCPCSEKSKRSKGYGPLPCVELSCAIKQRLNMSSVWGGHVVWYNWSFSSPTEVGLTFFPGKNEQTILSVPSCQVKTLWAGCSWNGLLQGLNPTYSYFAANLHHKGFSQGFFLRWKFAISGIFFWTVTIKCFSGVLVVTFS